MLSEKSIVLQIATSRNMKELISSMLTKKFAISRELSSLFPTYKLHIKADLHVRGMESSFYSGLLLAVLPFDVPSTNKFPNNQKTKSLVMRNDITGSPQTDAKNRVHTSLKTRKRVKFAEHSCKLDHRWYIDWTKLKIYRRRKRYKSATKQEIRIAVNCAVAYQCDTDLIMHSLVER